MDHDLVTDDADAAVLDWETGLPPIKHEDLRKIIELKDRSRTHSVAL